MEKATNAAKIKTKSTFSLEISKNFVSADPRE